MNLELEVCGSLCETEKFRINGIEADSDDFGDQGDQSPEDADDYCCDNMAFIRGSPKAEVLEKYGINEAEYAFIAGQLEAGLSFGNCGLCS